MHITEEKRAEQCMHFMARKAKPGGWYSQPAGGAGVRVVYALYAGSRRWGLPLVYILCRRSGIWKKGALERPHPTDVGWGFYGLAPVKPRQSSYGYSDMVLQLLIRRIKATGLYQRKRPSIPVHPYTCRIILLIRARGLSEEKLFVVRIPGRLISYILCKSMFVNQN